MVTQFCITCVVHTPEELDEVVLPPEDDEVELVEVFTQVIVGSLLLHWKSSQQYSPVSMQVVNPLAQITSFPGGQFKLPSRQLQQDMLSWQINSAALHESFPFTVLQQLAIPFTHLVPYETSEQLANASPAHVTIPLEQNTPDVVDPPEDEVDVTPLDEVDEIPLLVAHDIEQVRSTQSPPVGALQHCGGEPLLKHTLLGLLGLSQQGTQPLLQVATPLEHDALHETEPEEDVVVPPEDDVVVPEPEDDVELLVVFTQ